MIDANCVPDPSRDLERDAVTPYDNAGAPELMDLMLQKDLLDAARETLGDTPHYTSHHNTSAGITKTRIDQAYTPRVNGMVWTYSTLHHFMPPPR